MPDLRFIVELQSCIFDNLKRLLQCSVPSLIQIFSPYRNFDIRYDADILKWVPVWKIRADGSDQHNDIAVIEMLNERLTG